MRNQLSVTALAERLFRSGDIHASLDGRATTEEGLRTHSIVQKRRKLEFGDSFTSEVAVFGRSQGVSVSGRIDGLLKQGENWIVEEYKTTRIASDELLAHVGAVHWAQVTLYAGLLPEAPDSLCLRLIYIHPDSLVETVREQSLLRSQCAEFVLQALHRWALRLAEHAAYVRQRNTGIAAMVFPFGAFRRNQRALSGTVYNAVRKSASLLLEAPTGAGKSVATLFPAVKTLLDGAADQLFYLTSRNTGKQAPLAAQALLARAGGTIRCVEITAKQDICFVDGTPCTPDECEFARGYYDKLPAALADALEQDVLNRGAVEAIASEHVVCPFELSLDAALWCDLVVCDYNYLFDPLVRLQRFSGPQQAVLLIDEAHALTSRVRDMYSAELTRGEVKSATRQAQSFSALLAKAFASIDRAFAKRLKGVPRGSQELVDVDGDDWSSLGRAFDKLRDALTMLANDDGQGGALDQAPEPGQIDMVNEHSLSTSDAQRLWPDELQKAVFNALRFARALEWAEAERYLGVIDRRQTDVLQIRCLDSAPQIAEILSQFQANVRFSGTLAPLSLSQRSHGQHDLPDAQAVSVATPFTEDALLVAIVSDLPTRYRQRSGSLTQLVELAVAMSKERPGNYLLALPSFAYLEQVHEAFERDSPHTTLLVQTRDMAFDERARFVDALRDESRPQLALVVLGGVMTESLDFSGAALLGAMIVTVGLPPPDPIRDAISEHFTADGHDGFAAGYLFDAMSKTLQAAGRVLRSPDERGVVVLVDDRYARASYQSYFPSHWQPRVMRSHQLPATLRSFWDAALD
ncbi:MAG: hypothetical protein NXH85_13475 [Pseudomonadaceae bacterium]|nr:hypothetical protein [Pseudomonadaceae bacterium]